MNPHAQSFRHPGQAFTLVELLIVIIIALAALVVPMAHMNMSKWRHAQGGTPFGESPNGA